MEIRAGDVAVVTGAAGGIGSVLAEHGTEVLTARVDVRREDEVLALADTTGAHFGAVHVVSNNAGVSSCTDAWSGPIEVWRWVLDVNLFGVLHGVRAFLPHLVASGRGHIVNTASIAGLEPGVGAPYDASKHAVAALSEDLYLDLQARSRRWA